MAEPIDDSDFAAALGQLGPFEAGCTVAVAVSGGADSMALALLTDRWASERGGAIRALIVDHRLREGSTEEAAKVAQWLGSAGIEAEILVRPGERLASRIQATAREDRYTLLFEVCRRSNILHLLLGHHLDDQRETMTMRASRGGGGDGLAGMAAVREVAGLRLLRPLLRFPAERLRATLRAMGRPWIEDPSNIDPRFERVRLRAGSMGGTTLDIDALRSERRTRESRRVELLAEHVRPHPMGFVELVRAQEIEPEELSDLVRRCLWTVGGSSYPPRSEGVDAIATEILAERLRGRTLAGCIVRPRADRILILREPRAVGAGVARSSSDSVIWDGRFRIEPSSIPPSASIAALGTAGRRAIDRRSDGRIQRLALPREVMATLPAARVGGELVAIGFLGKIAGMVELRATWTPRQPLGAAIF